jgi:hypothetical protein
MLVKKIAFLVVLGVFALGFYACNDSGSVVPKTDNYSTESLAKLLEEMPVQSDTINTDVAEGLQYMREEEKLARDVYIMMNNTYHYRVFANISKSEQIHMRAIKFLLDRYGIEDPVTDNSIGAFQNQELKELFTTLVEQGNASGAEALKVGALIEEKDIVDLLERIDEASNYKDIVAIYKRLEKASENHLRAFVGNLKVRGVAYTPSYLDEDTFQRIINGRHVFPNPTDSTLSDEEKAALQYMREEEKLARDVYITFYKENGLRIFRHISKSEQVHMNAIKRLLRYYGVEDPAKGEKIGEFQNSDLQNLYDTLIAKGSASDIEALKVGAGIEEIDILDLFERMEKTKDHPRITRVFSRLEKGSEAHLRAFVRNLKAKGVVYEPQYLDKETYERIINP